MAEPDGTEEPKEFPARVRNKSEYLRQTSIGFYEGDIEVIQSIMENLGTRSMSDAVRTAVRAYAMHLEILFRRRES